MRRRMKMLVTSVMSASLFVLMASPASANEVVDFVLACAK